MIGVDRPQGRHSDSAIEITDLAKTYGQNDVPAVDGLSLTVGRGEFVSLLGPSGCGKTTTLRCVAGLERPDRGTIRVNGQLVNSDGVSLRPEERNISMVFQQYALFPHMSVWENVAFGLRVRRESPQRIRDLTTEALERVRMLHLKDRRIGQLSGGQQQRIALARAVAFKPATILFDEPLSNLDARLREEMRLELLALHRDVGFAALYVTHDQTEALSLSDRVVVMNHGQVEQVDVPRQVWLHPATPFVADFIGQHNRFDGDVVEVTSTTVRVITRGGTEFVVRPAQDHRFATGEHVALYLGYSDVAISSSPHAGEANSFTAALMLQSFEGHSSLFKVSLGKDELLARVPPKLSVLDGSSLYVHCDPASFQIYPIEHDPAGRT